METIRNYFLYLGLLNVDTISSISWILTPDTLSEGTWDHPFPSSYHQSSTRIKKNILTEIKQKVFDTSEAFWVLTTVNSINASLFKTWPGNQMREWSPATPCCRGFLAALGFCHPACSILPAELSQGWGQAPGWVRAAVFLCCQAIDSSSLFYFGSSFSTQGLFFFSCLCNIYFLFNSINICSYYCLHRFCAKCLQS